MTWIGRTNPAKAVLARDTEPSSEPAIVERIRAGDSQAFDALVVKYYESLLRLAFSYLNSRESAEEVVQEIFLRVWAQRATWSPEGTLKAYLFGATRNRAFSELRHRRVAQGVIDSSLSGEVLPFMAKAQTADAAQEGADLTIAIRAAIKALPPRMREAFVLSRQQHLSHEEIARVMGTSVKTVQEQIGRALKSLRRSLADWLT